MNSPQPPEWSRLIDAARRAPSDQRDVTAPFGFATRVAAQAIGAARAEYLSSLFSRYAWRALGVSCALMAICVVTNLRPIMAAIDDEAAALSDASTEVESTDLS